SIVPELLAALSGSSLNSSERAAVFELRSWNDSMDTGSAAATIWWKFFGDYVSEVFSPWWKAAKVPTSKDPSGLEVNAEQPPLEEDLQQWTLSDPGNAAFRGPSGDGFADARAAMVAAFKKAVSGLSSSLGGPPSSWTWGRVHSREFPSVS